MQPNDHNGALPPSQRPLRVLVIAGSDRRQYNCPGVGSKARTLMLRMAERLPQAWEIDTEDLGNVYGRARIQRKAPSHRWADVKLKWREMRMKMGVAPRGSSPAVQEAKGLNKDTGGAD